MSLDTVERCTFSARLDCHYLLHLPETVDGRTLLVMALHGYSSDAEVMLRLTKAMLGNTHVIASLEAPNQFYPSNAPDGAVGFSWGTRAHPAASVRLHHDMLLQVASEVGQRCRLGPERRLLVGFSQPVGMNYRFAATYPHEVHGVIGICGGVPRNWETGDYKPVTAALLHIARREDEIYPPAVTEQYAERLRNRARDVEFHMLEGGHRFPSKAVHLVEPWLERVYFAQSTP